MGDVYKNCLLSKFKIVVLVALTPVVVAVEVVRSHLPRVCDDPGIV